MRNPENPTFDEVRPNGAGEPLMDEVPNVPGNATGGGGAPRTSGMTQFLPEQRGFQFVNHFKNDFIPALDIHTEGLCGGMAYAALDYYHAQMATPNQPFRPANGTPLHSYLYDRQVDSIMGNWDKWAELGLNPGGIRDTEFFNWGISAKPGERIDELRRCIDAGKPVPLGLQGDGTTGNHQVVAFGYDMGQYKGDLGPHIEEFKIFVYDPNHPGTRRTLIPDVSNRLYRWAEGGSSRWRSYFVDLKYDAHGPPSVPPINYPPDGLIHELILTCLTGSDDMRGGNDNLDLVVNVADGTQQVYRNLNASARWIAHNDESARVMLVHPLRHEDIVSLVLSTTFGGGIGGDNWDLAEFYVFALGGDFYREIKTVGPKRFTGEDKILVVPLHPAVVSRPGQFASLDFTFTTGGDDLRGVNDNINIIIHFRDGQQHRMENANGGQGWANNAVHHLVVDLNRAVSPYDLVRIDIETTFGGGISGDNWDMQSVSVRAVNFTDDTLAFHGFKRFTGDDKHLTIDCPPFPPAQFVGQVVPTTMIPGQSYPVSVTFRNTGEKTWTSESLYHLGSQEPQDNDIWQTSPRIPLPADVPPWKEVTFSFTAIAPFTPGRYNFRWRMLQEGVDWFGPSTPNVTITVEAEQCVSIRSEIAAKRSLIKDLMAEWRDLDIRNTADRLRIREIKQEKSDLEWQIQDLEHTASGLRCNG